MRSLKVFLCEDDDLSAKVIKLVLIEYMKKKKFDVDLSYYSCYKENNDELFKSIDLAILDIDLGDSILNGIELAKKIRDINKCAVVIFITGHEDYALSASQIHLSGFLPKPLNLHDFQDALDRAIVQINGFLVTKREGRVAKFNNGRITLKEKSIISIEKITRTKEVNIRTTKETIIVYENIKNIENRLSDKFIKVNRSVIVNLHYVFKIENDTVVMNNGKSYTISVRQCKAVNEAFARLDIAF